MDHLKGQEMLPSGGAVEELSENIKVFSCFFPLW